MNWNIGRLLSRVSPAEVPTHRPKILDLCTLLPMKSGEEINVSLRDIANGRGSIMINDVKCVVYIKNLTTGLQKWHFYRCSALKGHTSFGKRYVVKSDTDGAFLLENGRLVELEPCSKCLDQSSMRDKWDSLSGNLEQRNSMFIPMVSNQEFFETLDSCFSHPRDALDHELSGYVRDWAGISYLYRKSKKWTCEQCGLNLATHKRLLHTHHIDMNKKNNDRSNFSALCVECHSKQPLHYERMAAKFAKDIEFIGILRSNQKNKS